MKLVTIKIKQDLIAKYVRLEQSNQPQARCHVLLVLRVKIKRVQEGPRVQRVWLEDIKVKKDNLPARNVRLANIKDQHFKLLVLTAKMDGSWMRPELLHVKHVLWVKPLLVKVKAHVTIAALDSIKMVLALFLVKIAIRVNTKPTQSNLDVCFVALVVFNLELEDHPVLANVIVATTVQPVQPMAVLKCVEKVTGAHLQRQHVTHSVQTCKEHQWVLILLVSVASKLVHMDSLAKMVKPDQTCNSMHLQHVNQIHQTHHT